MREVESYKGWKIYHIGKGRWAAVNRTKYHDYTLEETSEEKLKTKIDFYIGKI